MRAAAGRYSYGNGSRQNARDPVKGSHMQEKLVDDNYRGTFSAPESQFASREKPTVNDEAESRRAGPPMSRQ